jgi:ribonuclease D
MVPNQSPPATADAGSPWIADPDQLDAWLARSDAPLAVDTEFVRERTYWPRLALVQLGLPGHAAVLDPLAFGPPGALGRALVRPGRTILMHSASEDLVALRPLLPAPLAGLYDTQIAAAFAGLGPGLGYQATVERVTGVHLDKQETRSDWLTRPLSARQLAYALDDVRYLAQVHEHLDRKLRERGYGDWHLEDCLRMARAGHGAEPDPQPQLGFRGAWRLPLPAQAQLRRILLWREQAARERDLPKRWVLEDDLAVAAAQEPAHSAARLAARLESGPPGKRRSLQPLLDLLARPPDDAEVQATEAIAGPLDGELKPVVKRIKAAVESEATRLDLPAGLLCPRRAVERLATSGRWPDDLDGWRAQLLQPRLQELAEP